jgi:hypothetical protein
MKDKLKTILYNSDQGSAIELLELISKENDFNIWLQNKSTITLMQMANKFRSYSIYANRLEALPFDNDVYAIDAATLKVGA